MHGLPFFALLTLYFRNAGLRAPPMDTGLSLFYVRNCLPIKWDTAKRLHYLGSDRSAISSSSEGQLIPILALRQNPCSSTTSYHS